jgi:hypothetical protein
VISCEEICKTWVSLSLFKQALSTENGTFHEKGHGRSWHNTLFQHYRGGVLESHVKGKDCRFPEKQQCRLLYHEEKAHMRKKGLNSHIYILF